MFPKECKTSDNHASARNLTWNVKFCISVLKPKGSEGAQIHSLYKIISLTSWGFLSVLTMIAIVGNILVPFNKNGCDYQNISEVINEI